MPRKPTLAGTPAEKHIRKRRSEGASIEKTAAELGLPQRQVQTVFEHAAKDWSRPPLPDLAGKSHKEVAQLHAEWLHGCLAAAAQSAPAKDIALLSAQYTNALKHVARLDGALDITERQIVKTLAW